MPPYDAELDAVLRATALEFVRKLRDQHGGRMPYTALSQGVTVRGMQVPIWNRYKGIHKPAILGPHGAALTIQTSAESPYADEHDPESGEFLYMYRGKDPGEADNRALRAALLMQRPLIYLVAVDPGVYDAILPVFVVRDDAAKLQFTMVADLPGSQPSATPPELTTVRRQYVTRAVVQRLHQQQFRRIVLQAYGNRCTICRLKHLDLLDAAHILPDRHELGEPVISNGLGMCKIHHSAYDAKILGIDPDARVHIRVDVLKEKDGPMLKHGLQAIHGEKLHLPRAAEHRPNRDYLAERFEAFKR